jgi:hypothetical protein
VVRGLVRTNFVDIWEGSSGSVRDNQTNVAIYGRTYPEISRLVVRTWSVCESSAVGA